MENIIDFGLLVAIVIGVVQVAKGAGTPKRLLPVVSLFLGVLAAFVVGFKVLPASEIIIQGIIIGLSASGIWSSVKTTVRG